jgi:hypothetical protein
LPVPHLSGLRAVLGRVAPFVLVVGALFPDVHDLPRFVALFFSDEQLSLHRAQVL